MVVDRGHVNGLENTFVNRYRSHHHKEQKNWKINYKINSQTKPSKTFLKKEQPPQWLMTLAKFHEDLHYNI